MFNQVRRFAAANTWVWAALGALLLWAVMGVSSGRLSFESLATNAYIASFLGIVALGQMLVVTSGRGAIDLSIPGVITLGAYVSLKVISGNDAMMIPGIIVIVLLGLLIGLINGSLVIWLRVPPIIATMAVNYILITMSLMINRGFADFVVNPMLQSFTKCKVLGLPVLVYIVLLLAAGIHLILNKTSYGRSLLALGQNYEAARLAGVKVIRVELITYMFSSVLAAMTGLLIAARVRGAFLGMGDSYMLESVASIVIGGTLISGGRANPAGALAGALFLGLIVTAMQLMGFGLGAQNVAKGLLIIIVLVISMSGGQTRPESFKPLLAKEGDEQ